MKSIYTNFILALFLSISSIANSQILVSATDLGLFPKVIISASGLTNADYNVRMYKVTYNTSDLSGNPVVASGMICVPINPTCDSLPVALYAHGTVLKRDDVPSGNNNESVIGKAIASKGYVTAMPDYLGLGDLMGLHPYQHAESEAIVSVDILRAAKEFIADSMNFTFSNEVFITGYSQGGHAAMATTKYIQDNNLGSELNVVASAPLSGAFHASKRQTDELLLDIPYNSPGYIVYLILSYQEAYGGIFTTPSDFLQSPYDTTIPPLFDGSVAMSVVHAALPNKTSLYLNTTFLNAFIADSTAKTSALWQALLDNDNFDWKPTSKLKMFYCTGDQTVKPKNTEDAYDAMIANGATQVFKEDLGATLDHGGCVVPAVSNAITYFQGIRTDCKTPNGISENTNVAVQINTYPNPSTNFFTIELKNDTEAKIEIYSLGGQLIYQTDIQKSIRINTKKWQSGSYALRVVSGNAQTLKTFTVTH
tara:strand:+ start:109512 stop:110951 length:1440 start_codon:yes stop_codon:yes gene_type:complete